MAWQDKIRNPDCTACPLHESAEYVCLMGQGRKSAKVMVVGEAPGAREDEEHAAFVGPSGKLLRESLAQVGISEKDYYITNVAKCRPPENRTPSKQEAKICSGLYLAGEIEAVQPEFILGVGNAPLAAFTRNSGITKHRGRFFDLGVGKFFPTFHPAYVLRSPQHGPTFRSDLQRFARAVRGEEATALHTRTYLIRNRSQLETLIRTLDKATHISFDLETTSEGSGKNIRYHQPHDAEGRIVTLQFSWATGLGAVVPLWHDETPWKHPDKVLRAFREIFLLKDPKFIAHNGKFDVKWLASKGIFARLDFDTMLAAHLLDENRAKALETLAQILLSADGWKSGDITKNAQSTPLRDLAIYGAKDVDYTLRLYYLFRQQLREDKRLVKIFKELMMGGSEVLVQTESVGMYVHGDRLKKALVAKRRERDQIEKRMLKHVPKSKRATFNFRSTKQVPEWLFGDLGLNPVHTTKASTEENPKYSTDEHTLKVLHDQHPVIPDLLKYRTVDMKDLRTYLEKWDEWRDARSRIHTTYKLFGTVTGRLSSEKPNLQQVPREGVLRSVFGAPPGWVFVEADYAQVELRIAAMLAQEPTLLRIFHTGGDPHLVTAAELAELSPEAVLASDATGKTEHRKKAKPVNFGFLYGMGEAKFIDYAFDNYGLVVNEQESHEYRQKYFRLYPRLLTWHARQRRLVNKYGYVRSPLGRIRHLPDVWSNDPKVQAEAERQAINSPVQVTASDLMLLSMVRLHREFHPSVARIVGTVHDAILTEMKPEFVDEGQALIKEVMEDMDYVNRVFDYEVTVPIRVDFKTGQYWGGG